MRNLVLRLAAVIAVGIGASACSSTPDWVDPTTWLSDKAPPVGEDGKATDLADIPGKPPTTTPDEQKQVSDSLAADRAQAGYSAEQLRADADTTAPPPPAASSSDTTATEPAAGAHTESPASADQTASAESPTPATAQSAATEAPPAEAPSAPPPAAAVTQSDSAAGFRASAAPPLDPSVAQYVSPSVMARYQHTASASPNTAPSAAPAGVQTALAATPSGTPAAVVYFPGDGTTLNAAARAKVQEAVAAYQAKGGQGYVRVVGHSSSRTPNMPVEKHLQVIFQRSQDRANAVAKELIREGVPAEKVLVEAVGDSQPVYFESMPKGEEGNRRAEIFLQS